jgi:hypothetical protein
LTIFILVFQNRASCAGDRELYYRRLTNCILLVFIGDIADIIYLFETATESVSTSCRAPDFNSPTMVEPGLIVTGRVIL